MSYRGSGGGGNRQHHYRRGGSGGHRYRGAYSSAAAAAASSHGSESESYDDDDQYRRRQHYPQVRQPRHQYYQQQRSATESSESDSESSNAGRHTQRRVYKPASAAATATTATDQSSSSSTDTRVTDSAAHSYLPHFSQSSLIAERFSGSSPRMSASVTSSSASASSPSAVISKDEKSSIASSEIIPRMAGGSVGRPITLITNFFNLNFKARDCFWYLAEFYPPIDPTDTAIRTQRFRKFHRQLKDFFDVRAFDGGNTFLTLNRIPKDFQPPHNCVSQIIRTDTISLAEAAQVKSREEEKSTATLLLTAPASPAATSASASAIGSTSASLPSPHHSASAALASVTTPSASSKAEQIAGPEAKACELKAFVCVRNDFECVTFVNGESRLSLTFKKAIPTGDTSNQQVTTVANILVKQLLRKLDLIRFTRVKYFYPNAMPLSQQEDLGAAYYLGFTASVSPTQVGFQFVVDLSHKVRSSLTARQVMDFVEQQQHGVSAAQLQDAVTQEFRGRVVLAIHNQLVWHIDDVDFSLSLDSVMPVQRGDGRKTFRDYYEEKYPATREQLANSRKPGMLLHIKKNAERIYLPPELCYLTGVSDRIRSNNRIMAALARVTRKDPQKRFDEIKRLISNILNSSPDIQRELQKLPLSLCGDPSTCPGRVLGPFQIEFSNGHAKTVSPGAVGDWSREAREAGFFRGNLSTAIDNWTVMYEESFYQLAGQVGDRLQGLAAKQGGKLAPPSSVMVRASRGRRGELSWMDAFNEVKRIQPSFVLILIPAGNERIYSLVKHQLSTAGGLGIISQCLDTNNLRNPGKLNPILGNSYKQIMSKLGHELWRINFSRTLSHPAFAGKRKIMVVGVDVCRTRRSKQNYGTLPFHAASTVAVCATYNEHLTAYHSAIAFQEDRFDDYVRDSEILMRQMLEGYLQKNGNEAPEYVLVYRDGVSNTELDSFVDKEIKQYENAFKALNMSPKLTVVVCQKRISPRFWETKPCDLYSRGTLCQVRGRECQGDSEFHCTAPPPGTVIDGVLADQKYSDFYLVNNSPPIGCSPRPVRYIALRCDPHWTMDELQAFTFQQAQIYFNWNGTIRLPAPVMCADKLARLFGMQVNGIPHPNLTSKLHFL